MGIWDRLWELRRSRLGPRSPPPAPGRGARLTDGAT
jgi:hypothetical protein